MLRITRLHLLIAGIGVLCLIFGILNWIRQTPEAGSRQALKKAHSEHVAPRQRLEPMHQQEEEAMEKQRRTAAQSIATIGEAYKPLRQRFGDVPPISRSLRAAKQYQAQGQTEQALASARESWLALKIFRTRVGQAPQTYHVVRGDTLWRIAATHSPARAGAGWVTIWKANKDLVNDFNRLEVGWTLTIPPKRAQYDMPFWKPH